MGPLLTFFFLLEFLFINFFLIKAKWTKITKSFIFLKNGKKDQVLEVTFFFRAKHDVFLFFLIVLETRITVKASNFEPHET
jgi:hypothetical protein